MGRRMKVLIGVILIGVLSFLFWKNYERQTRLASAAPLTDSEARTQPSARSKTNSRSGTTGGDFIGAHPLSSEKLPRDSRVNAAHQLRQAFELLKQEPLSQLKQLNPNSAEFRQKIRELMMTPEFQQWQRLVKEAIAAGNCDWEIDYSQGYATIMPHLGDLRWSSMILSALGSLHAESGVAGFQDFSDNFKLISMTSDNQTLIANLVRSSMLKQCENELSAAVNLKGQTADDGEEIRNHLQDQLHDTSTGLRESFSNEFAVTAKMLEKMQSGSFDLQTLGGDESLVSLVDDPVRAAIVKAEFTEATQSFQNALESANNWQERLQAAEQLEKATSKLSPESRILLASLPALVNKMANTEAHTQATLASLQIEQFRRQNGRLPESLAEAGVAIDDPIIAGKLDYKDGKVEVKK